MLGSKDNLQAALLAIPMELARITSELQAGLAEFHNGQRLDAARHVSIDRPLAWGGSCRLLGWSLRNTTGQIATFNFRDGNSVEAPEIVAAFSLGVGANQTVWLGPTGISCSEGLYIERLGTGTDPMTGSIFLGAVD